MQNRRPMKFTKNYKSITRWLTRTWNPGQRDLIVLLRVFDNIFDAGLVRVCRPTSFNVRNKIYSFCFLKWFVRLRDFENVGVVETCKDSDNLKQCDSWQFLTDSIEYVLCILFVYCWRFNSWTNIGEVWVNQLLDFLLIWVTWNNNSYF